MAYEFHYTPTGTGVISGKEVLEQTEDAINDLGNTAISGVQEALDKAEQALTNSENAVDDAQTALNTANNAEGVAIQAQNDVSNLSGTVTNLGNRVTTAEGNIDNLQGRMTTADGNITNIQGRMTTAEGNIGNLQTAVSTAQATANSAQQTATTARQQSYVFRYSSTALVASSTNSNALLDNTDNLKVGDKVIDASGVIYSVTAIDTANSTFTVGSALIDIALDGNVVHKSGNETISGQKTFTNHLNLKSNSAEYGVTSGNIQFLFMDKNSNGLSKINQGVYGNGVSYIALQIYGRDENSQSVTNAITFQYGRNFDMSYLLPSDNSVWLGKSGNRWGGVYATNYYYGGSEIEFSQKFVTTDTNQTINGNKDFNGNTNCVGELNQTAPFKMTADTSFVTGGKNTSIYDQNGFQCSNELIIYNNNKNIRRAWTLYNNSSGTNVSAGFNFILSASGQKVFYPISDGDTDNGSSSAYWKSIYTKKVNGVEPSSLSLPSSRDSRVDISSYFTDTSNGAVNRYTVPANGYIYLNVTDVVTMHILAQTSNNLTHYGDTRGRSSVGQLYALLPVRKDDVFACQWYTTATNVTLSSAYFIPCQGNV